MGAVASAISNALDNSKEDEEKKGAAGAHDEARQR
jgi:hypothetical protein